MGRVYISGEAGQELCSYISGMDHEIIKAEKTDAVYDEVSAHPDIYMCKLGALAEDPVFAGNRENLGYRYPENIIYNAAVCGRYFIHNTRYTDPELFSAAGEYIKEKYADSEDPGRRVMKKVYVRQGYTKCNIAVIDDSHIITEDRGIAKEIAHKCGDDIKVLLIEHGHVALRGFPYGFIGGASGRVGNEMIFNGSIKEHPDYSRIKEFIGDAGLAVKDFGYELTDIGSIIYEA